MSDRDQGADLFIATTDWAEATRHPLAGDASNRRYDRLVRAETGETAVLMDAPSARGEDVTPFIAIAKHLSDLGLSAPRILAEDRSQGFLLLEDLGDALFARVLAAGTAHEDVLYAAATDLLVTLHQAPVPNVPAYDAGAMTPLAGLALSKYRAAITRQADPALETEFAALMQPLLAAHAAERPVLVLRDYHAENLIWLPDRTGIERVGLLDFQDAMAGHPAYDLVSLLQDARRDVPPGLERAMIDRYCAATGAERDRFAADYAVIGAQRNLRILGVFARLGLEHGKPHYVDLIPRVWGLLQRDLAHPALAPLARFASKALPEPTPEALDRLRGGRAA
ncbi:MAG TPA: aminoglycoside phosphotransferase [Rhodobacteraceae bacterium]|nr:aminoglycoside phosphotransferase [Paracoccaceae bacterium]